MIVWVLHAKGELQKEVLSLSSGGGESLSHLGCCSPGLTSREMSVPFQVAVSSVKGARPSLSVVSVCVVVPCLP